MNTFKKICATFILVIIFALSSGPIIITRAASTPNNANTTYTLLEPLPCINGSGTKCTPGEMITSVNFQNYVQYAINLIIALAAAAAVFMIVWGGFEYMSKDAWDKKSAGLSKVQNALLGLALVLCSYLILQAVDPRLVKIPTTLVKPLNITYSKSFTESLFNKLKGDAQEYMTKIGEAKDKIAETDAKIDTLLKQRDDIVKRVEDLSNGEMSANDSCIYPESQSPELVAACLEWAKNDEELSQQIGIQTVAMKIGTINAVLRENARNVDSIYDNNILFSDDNAIKKHFKEERARIETMYMSGISDLNAVGSPTDENGTLLRSQLEDVKYLALAKLDVQEALATYKKSAGEGSVAASVAGTAAGLAVVGVYGVSAVASGGGTLVAAGAVAGAALATQGVITQQLGRISASGSQRTASDQIYATVGKYADNVHTPEAKLEIYKNVSAALSMIQ